MHKSTASPKRCVVLPDSNSVLQINDLDEDRNYLLHRIELLQMENEELRRREDHLRKVNVTLTDALGNKNQHPEQLKNIIKEILREKNGCTHPEADDRKQLSSQGQQTDQQFKSAFSSPSRLRKQNPQRDCSFSIHTSEFHDTKREYQTSRNFYEQTQNLTYNFQKLKSPQSQQNRSSISAFDRPGCSTPYRHSKMTANVQSFHNTQPFFEGPVTTQRSASRTTLCRNIATELLCDICNVSFSPMQFLSHVQQCQGEEQGSSNTLDVDFSGQDDEGSQQLVYMLESRKKKLAVQIEKLKKARSSPERKKRLQTDMDQIVFIIKNKKTLNNTDIKKLLKEKNYYEKCFR